MDPTSLETVQAAVTAAAQGGASEAGRQAWTSLTSLVRRAFGRDAEEPEAPVLPLEPQDERQIRSLSALIYARALQDQGFAAAFAEWQRETEVALRPRHATNNIVGGNARVTNLVQGQIVTWNTNT
ncbi:hypothetical protein OG946_07030 [Streptomyces sp. NBC_01808]|uniref:hypothetical protein n=1 Tax=Streptomyces sp. NBC_01808 TaxID=2975947 RepID=UPI002DD870FC|nr:hypothetical protein [Streptomyces sp. NBC_01808]WSA37148.1 hypothetical protein OG946_07030 [Streptomyces sp. NBC_01808]